jgi:hypothetical protein
MVKNEHFVLGLLHTLAVIFFLGGIFLDYYAYMTGLFVLIAVSVFTRFLRPHMSSGKPSKITKKTSIGAVNPQKPAKVKGNNAFCIKCGAQLEIEDEYCPSCGTLNEN